MYHRHTKLVLTFLYFSFNGFLPFLGLFFLLYFRCNEIFVMQLEIGIYHCLKVREKESCISRSTLT